MSDDLTRRKPEDPTKININQQWELDYWTQELKVSEKTLNAAVSSLGQKEKANGQKNASCCPQQ